jgi:hypothetical protein
MRNGKRATNSHPIEAFILRNVQSRRSPLMGRSPKSPNSNSNNGQKNGNGPPTVAATDQVIDSPKLCTDFCRSNDFRGAPYTSLFRIVGIFLISR